MIMHGIPLQGRVFGISATFCTQILYNTNFIDSVPKILHPQADFQSVIV